MTTWFYFVGALAGGGSAGEFGGDNRIYSLIVEFSDDDIVSNLMVVTDRHPCSKDKAICYVDGNLIAANGPTTAGQTYRDESPNGSTSDARLQALREIERFLATSDSGDEVELADQRFSATLESGGEVELVERDSLIFDARTGKPFSGQINRWYGDIVAMLSYEAGLLHGPAIVRDGDGTVLVQANYEHGKISVSGENN